MDDAAKASGAVSPEGVPGAATVRRDWILWIAGSALFLALFFALYPRATVIVDEARFLTVADAFMKGRAFDPSSDAWFWKETDHGWRRVLDSTSPFFSILLIPFVAIGWRSAFLIGPVAHVLAFGGMIFILRRRGLSPWWATLYLLYPTAVLYGRTIMADVPSAALVVLVLVILHSRRPSWLLVGLLLGLGALLKLSNLPVMGTFLAVLVLRDLAARRRGAAGDSARVNVWALALGVVPGLVLQAAIAWCFFGSPTGNGYAGVEQGLFSPAYFAGHFEFYALGLLGLYPLMLVAPIFLGGPYRWEIRAACLVALLFFSFYYFIDPGNSWYETLVRAMRFQLVVLPCYLIAYAHAGEWAAGKVGWKAALTPALVAGSVLLAAAAVAIGAKLADFARAEGELQDRLAKVLPERGTLIVTRASKYVSSLRSPGLRIVRGLTEPEVPYLVRGAPEPVVMLLVDPESIRTASYRAEAAADREWALKIVGQSFDAERDRSRDVDGFKFWELKPKVAPPSADGPR